MLQECPTCEGKVSSAAAACPHCGHPIGKPTDPERSERTVTTQDTGKGVKLNEMLGMLITGTGFLITISAEGHTGAIIMMIGVTWWLIASLVGWWHYD